VKLGILGRGYTQRCLSLYKNRITEKVFPVFPVRPCVAEKVQPVGSTYLCEALDQTPLPHLVNHPKGPWWATDALKQDLCRVLGPANTSHRVCYGVRSGVVVLYTTSLYAYAFFSGSGSARRVVVE
jgi:hypothetical protein